VCGGARFEGMDTRQGTSVSPAASATTVGEEETEMRRLAQEEITAEEEIFDDEDELSAVLTPSLSL
jgi:hypothetical protein